MNEAEFVGIAAAALGGLAVGIEREWSGHADDPKQGFGGVRTFTLLGGVAGLAGWLSKGGEALPAAVLLAGAAGLVIAAYVAASRRDVGGTTEVAALIVLGAGFAAGRGALVLASAVVATTVLILVEKSRLHGMVQRINDAELRAGARFAVMAIVILPLLPEGPYGPYGGIRPRALWALVLLFAGLSFAGYVAQRAFGAQRGYPLAGLLGGLVSSTQATLAFARLSRGDERLGGSLACGALAASTVLFVRTAVASAVLDRGLAVALSPYLGAGLAAGLLAVGLTFRTSGARARAAPEPPSNPLQMRNAVQMALLFQAVLTGVNLLRDHFGDVGLLASAAVVGLTDVDAVTVSMADAVRNGVPATLAAQAVAVGILSNTFTKLGLAAALGRGRFRILTVAGLGAVALAVAVALFTLR